MFLYYKRHGMNFHSCEKQIFQFFGCTKMNQKQPKRSNLTHNQQQGFTTNFSLPSPQPVIVSSWESRFKIFEFECLWNQEECSP